MLELREELLSLIDEADGINISVNDLICMMLQIGISDQGLQRTYPPSLFLKKSRVMSRLAKQHVLLFLAILLREVLPNVALLIRALALQVPIFLMAGGNGADATLCAASAFAAQKTIT